MSVGIDTKRHPLYLREKGKKSIDKISGQGGGSEVWVLSTKGTPILDREKIKNSLIRC